ncbi:hypothetical protein [Leptospira yasudae]|uniref:Uncharacterized protein n=1 Tax=Leptospira yasudae TaxID=2202201 RepID=A0A6N4QYN7_9LEPT|nr:hypothetical protein [Leptospira yasudae]TGL78156.1 hypothetical protein EHQ72_10355 [Leptospira yasudae]TGL80698.1 hypothetical protein EHQ77_08265 [Leptospira yasudae]TGL88939.1 hypothetical protein EHQ83_02740 [Leptospira yasudae]
MEKYIRILLTLSFFLIVPIYGQSKSFGLPSEPLFGPRIFAQSSTLPDDAVPVNDPNVNPNPPIIDPNAPKPESKKKGPKWFSINPGITLESVTVDITGKGNNATMTQEGPGKATWMLDVKSRDFQFFEYVGVHLLLHNSSFFLDNQFMPKPVEAPSGSSSSSSSGSSSNQSTSGDRTKQDVNTRIEGVYSMAIPILYFGKEGSDSFRFGLGAGPANVRMTGSVDFQDPALSLGYLLLDSTNRTTFLNTISALQFITGNISPASGDPLVSYLLSNLSTGKNLEMLGYYYASKGLLKPDPLALYAYFAHPGTYTPLEALTLGSLARSQVNFSKQQVFSFMFYFETPKIGYFKFRLAFGGPLFKDNGYTYEFRTFHLALFTPIEF